MEKYIICFLITIITSNKAYTQCSNLVQNGDFETFTSCPTILTQINLASPWDRVGPLSGTSDYLNACAGSSVASNFPGVPQNFIGTQSPNSGNGYAGFITYAGLTSFGGPNGAPNYREYIQQSLLTPMQVGQTYQVSLYVSLAENARYGTDGMEAYFSTSPILAANNLILPLAPQISNPAGNILTNTAGWTQISQTFIPAQPYTNICIGSFINDASTQFVVTNPSFFFVLPFSYYYIDDVSVVCLTCCPLPIELLSFGTIVENNNKVKLTWVTATEINNDFFTIERSLDAINFESIKTIKGAGNSNSILNYEYFDDKPKSGINYYRLKQTDFNGEFNYSEIESVSITSADKIKVYPNPTENFLNLEINLNISENVLLEINDILGRSFIKKILKKTEKNNPIIIDVKKLPQGVYLLSIKTEKGIYITKKIIKK